MVYLSQMKKYLIPLVILYILTLTGTLQAHDWYPAACCSGNDCHPVPCEQLKEVGRNLVYQGFSFYDTMIKPSLDEACHVCISNEFSIENYSPVPHCVFIQQGS